MIVIVASRSLTLSVYFIHFSFSVYVLFVCILFVHFFLLYVSSVYFLLYKHTGAGGNSLIKVPESSFMSVTRIHFHP